MEKKNKKESYETPSVELLKFDNNDVITTSGFFGEEDNSGRGDRSGSDRDDTYTTPDVTVD